MTNADTICRSCLRLKQGLCDGEKELTACPSYKRMTNADRIRAMNDEELVQFIMSPCMKWNEPCPRSSCFDCLRDWLKEDVNCESIRIIRRG